MKVLCVAEGIIAVQVYACKPSKQSAGCESEVMHHWPRNTNTEVCLLCLFPFVTPWALLACVLSCPTTMQIQEAGNIRAVIDTYEIGFELLLFVL